MAQNLFLWPEDSLDDVRDIRNLALTSRVSGGQIEWTSENISYKKAASVESINELIQICNRYLRTYDPVLRAKNPVIKKTTGDMSRQ